MPNDPIETKELGVDAMIEFMKEEGEDEEKKAPPKSEGKAEDKEDDEEDKEEAKEEKEEEPEIKFVEDEEDSEPEEDIRLQASRKELLRDFPELFKKHPWLEKTIYRNNAYTEVFPTVDDAKEAAQATEMLNQFRNDLFGGNIETTLNTIKVNDKEAFNRVVDGYLPQLAKVDKEAYYHVVGNVIRTMTVNMAREARNSKNTSLETAAALVNKWMFGTDEFQAPTNLSKTDKDSEERTKLQQERETFQRERYETVVGEMDKKVENVLRSTITENIDPKDAMSDYIKKNATREAYESLEDLIRQDTNFVAHLNKLWEKAYQHNFSKSSVDSVRAAYLSKARTLLPSVIKKARVEALRGLGKRTVETEEAKDKRGPITPGRSASHNSGKIRNARDIPKGMSTLDFLNSDD